MNSNRGSISRKKAYIYILLGIFLAIVGYICYILILIIVIDPSAKRLAFYQEMEHIAHKLKQNKNEKGNYPETLGQIGVSDEICVGNLPLKFCSTLHYQPSTNKQDFRMAMRPFKTQILFYHPEISMTQQEYAQLSKTQIENLLKKYGYLCFYCEAFPQSPVIIGKKPYPIYKQDPKIFSNPNEWPDL